MVKNAMDKEILRLALPSIVSNITVPLLGLCDVTIMGHVGGAASIAAIAVGSMILTALGLKPSKPKIILETGDESLLEFDMRSAAEYFGVPRTVIPQRKRKNDGEKHCKN